MKHSLTLALCSILLLIQTQLGFAGAKKHEPPKEIKVAIVGGGLSGLTTAYRLSKFADSLSAIGVHLKIQVYEARRRLGGRVFTVMINNAPIEMGGQYLEDGGDAREIRELIQEVGLNTILFHRPTQTHFFRESISESTHDSTNESTNEKGQSQAKDIKIYDEIMPKVERISSEKEKQDLIEFLTTLEKKHSTMEGIVNEFFETKRQKALAEGNLARADAYSVLKDYFKTRIMTYESLPPSELASTYATGSFLHFLLSSEDNYHEVLESQKTCPSSQGGEINSFEASSVEGGNGRLIGALSKAVEAKNVEILSEMPLAELKKEQDESYTLKFKNGLKVHANIVVLTVPAPIYNRINFLGNSIPEKQLKEIRKIKYGPVGKILLPVKNSHPEEMFGSVFTSDMLTWFNRDSARDQENPQSVVTFYFTGDGKILKIPFNQLNQNTKSESAALLRPERELEFEVAANQRFKVAVDALKAAFPNLSLPEDGKDLSVESPAEKQLMSYSKPLGMNWAAEEYSLGGYSVISSEQALTFSPAQLKESLGQKVFAIFEPVLPKGEHGKCAYCGLYFAGEHTATQGTPATMEGAVHSGNKVGHQIPLRLKEVMRPR